MLAKASQDMVFVVTQCKQNKHCSFAQERPLNTIWCISTLYLDLTLQYHKQETINLLEHIQWKNVITFHLLADFTVRKFITHTQPKLLWWPSFFQVVLYRISVGWFSFMIRSPNEVTLSGLFYHLSKSSISTWDPTLPLFML